MTRPTWARRLAFAAIIGVTLLLLAACKESSPQSTFDPHGPVADDQLDLFLLIFWLAVGVFIIVEGMLIFSLFRFRRRKGQQELPKQVHGNNTLEVVWTLIPVAILTAIAIPTYMTMADTNSPPEGDSVTVNVVGHQWWWEFRYPDLGVVTATEMHIPVDKVVKINLHSDEVVHSFWVPKLAGKVDVFPNKVNKMWFIADDAGTYFGHCAELCGVDHALMRFRVVAQPQADFDAWVAGQKQPSPAATGAAAEGQRVFATKGCVLCHTNTGPDGDQVQPGRARGFEQGQKVFPGPNLTYFATRDTFAGAIVDLNEDNLRKWLQNPDEVKPGNRMAELAAAYNDPALQLSQRDIDALVAYLLSRKPAAPAK